MEVGMENMLLLLAIRQCAVLFVMDHYFGLYIILFRWTLSSFWLCSFQISFTTYTSKHRRYL